jgi:hypothetical protein
VRLANSNKWLAAGVAVSAAGVALGAGYWIYVLSTHRSFWRAPGLVAIALVVAGLALLAAGILATDEEPSPMQSIQSGDGSTNIQIVSTRDHSHRTKDAE